MSDKLCSLCGAKSRVLKTGFHFVYDDAMVYTSDLFGCYECGHIQVFGIPERPAPHWPIYGRVQGRMRVQDETYSMIPMPHILFSTYYIQHMEEWYKNQKVVGIDWPFDLTDSYIATRRVENCP